MKNLHKITLLLVAIVMMSVSSYGQDLQVCSSGSIINKGSIVINNNATTILNDGSIENNGTILFENSVPVFTNNGTFDNTYDAADGTLEFSGQIGEASSDAIFTGTAELAVDNASRIDGIVLYSNTGGTSNIAPGFYHNLSLSEVGGKSFNDATFNINGVYDISAAITDGGDRNYATSTLIFDATTAQLLTGETGDLTDDTGVLNENVYYTVQLTGGVKTLQATDAMPVDQLTQNNGTNAFNVSGQLFLGASGAGNSTFLNAVIAEGDRTALTGGVLRMQDGAALTVAALLDNGDAEGNNVDFGASSTVTYTTATEIMPTISTHAYANLLLDNTAAGKDVEDAAYTNNVYIDGDFTLNGTNNLDLATNSDMLVMSDYAASATYGSTGEVAGQMRRDIGLTYVDATDMTFNNGQTIISLTDGDELTNITLDVAPSTNWSTAFTAVSDVNRTIDFDYENAGAAVNWAATVRYGYQYGERPTGSDGEEASIRFKELLSGTNFEKVATGSDVARGASASGVLGYAELPAIIPTGGTANGIPLAQIADAGTLFLRGGPNTFYTIADGRWSNYSTWDEGIQPSSTDSAVILHTVHVGFRRDGVDGNTGSGGALFGDNGDWLETDFTGYSDGLARQIRVDNTTGASLVFGDNSSTAFTDEDNLTWELLTGGILINDNITGITFSDIDEGDLTAFLASATDENGLIILGNTTSTNLLVRANTLKNCGEAAVGANATLEIGDE